LSNTTIIYNIGGVLTFVESVPTVTSRTLGTIIIHQVEHPQTSEKECQH